MQPQRCGRTRATHLRAGTRLAISSRNLGGDHMHRLLIALGALALALASCGGETVVSGFGNSGNVIGVDVVGRVAEELAEAPGVPAVSDDDLRATFGAIREKALAGDPEAALVLLLLAAEQRDKG
jgi:hypothetical protein